jgi:UDP-glucose:(heptosyl)LPS alpha-1,3-glucosyltransferase
VLLGLPVDARCLLFVGNDYRKKGLQTLLAAFAQLPADVVLVVVGNAAHIPAFREQAQAFKLEGRVFFLGSLKEVGPAYEAADCLVHPTLEDTFAMVVLEAMAHGLPVVVSGPAYCGISGLLQHAVNAMILDDPRDANNLAQLVARVLGQRTLQDQLAHGAKEFASHYQWREIALKQQSLYFSVLAARKSTAVP